MKSGIFWYRPTRVVPDKGPLKRLCVYVCVLLFMLQLRFVSYAINGYVMLCYLILLVTLGWLGSRVVSVLDSGAKGPGSNRSRDAVG